MRRKVSVAAGAGMPHEQIAQALGISRNTLEKHFKDELSAGASVRRLEVLEALYKTAVRGNVSAQKAYVALGSPAGEKAEAPGKKAAANAAAKTAAKGTDWDGLLPEGVVPINKARG